MYNNRRFSYEVRSRVPRVQTVRRMSPIAVIFLVLFIIGACVGSGFLGAKLVGDKIKNTMPTTQNTTIIYREPADRVEYVATNGETKSSQEVAAIVKQSIVEIFSETALYSTRSTNYVNGGGVGSGVIIADGGYILTAYHVIEDAEEVRVRLHDGNTYNAEWIKGDKLSDLAVVKIPAQTLNSADIGRSSNVMSGEEIVAIGHPFGELGSAVTLGNVSALERTVTIGGKKLEGLMQLACPLNPGDSGGGIFNMQGRLIGIINARGVGDYGNNIGFASPIDYAMSIAEDVMKNGYVTGRVDVSALDLKEISNSASTPAGLYFMKVNNSDLHLSLKNQDYIVSVAGVQVTTLQEWEDVLNSKQVGSVVEIKYRRDGIEGTVKMPILQRRDCD